MILTYNKNLQANPHITLRNLSPLIRYGLSTGKEVRTKTAVKLGDIGYIIGFSPDSMTITLQWTEDGAKVKRCIRLKEESSNLPSLSGTSVYYFICPRSGVKCRTLYKIGTYFWSRRSFPNAYYLQNASKKERVLYLGESPVRKGGKKTYRGKITPYGKRIQRYEEREDRQFEAFLIWSAKIDKKYF